MFEDDGIDEQEYPTEAARITATRARCSYCGDDTSQLFQIRVEVYDLRGERMTGRRICDVCMTAQGFTGWGYTAGGWPARDVLGRANPAERAIEPPTDWREIGAALEGQPTRPLAGNVREAA